MIAEYSVLKVLHQHKIQKQLKTYVLGGWRYNHVTGPTDADGPLSTLLVAAVFKFLGGWRYNHVTGPTDGDGQLSTLLVTDVFILINNWTKERQRKLVILVFQNNLNCCNKDHYEYMKI